MYITIRYFLFILIMKLHSQYPRLLYLPTITIKIITSASYYTNPSQYIIAFTAIGITIITSSLTINAIIYTLTYKISFPTPSITITTTATIFTITIATIASFLRRGLPRRGLCRVCLRHRQCYIINYPQ